MQIKTTMRHHYTCTRMTNFLKLTHYHLTPTTMTTIQKKKKIKKKPANSNNNVEKLEPLYTVGRNAKWYGHCGKQYGGSSNPHKMELSYDSAIPLLGMYQKELKAGSHRGVCISMFIVASE